MYDEGDDEVTQIGRFPVGYRRARPLDKDEIAAIRETHPDLRVTKRWVVWLDEDTRMHMLGRPYGRRWREDKRKHEAIMLCSDVLHWV